MLANGAETKRMEHSSYRSRNVFFFSKWQSCCVDQSFCAMVYFPWSFGLFQESTRCMWFAWWTGRCFQVIALCPALSVFIPVNTIHTVCLRTNKGLSCTKWSVHWRNIIPLKADLQSSLCVLSCFTISTECPCVYTEKGYLWYFFQHYRLNKPPHPQYLQVLLHSSRTQCHLGTEMPSTTTPTVFSVCVSLLQMNLLLKEYLISGDVSEAEHCLRDLEVPHFHHELVYEVFKCWCDCVTDVQINKWNKIKKCMKTKLDTEV